MRRVSNPLVGGECGRAGHPEIEAFSSQRFDMRIDVPKGLPPGAADLIWGMRGDFGPTATTSVQIVP